MVQFYPWFKFYFPLFQTHYHTYPYPKTKENKIQTKDDIEPQHIYKGPKYCWSEVTTFNIMAATKTAM